MAKKKQKAQRTKRIPKEGDFYVTEDGEVRQVISSNKTTSVFLNLDGTAYVHLNSQLDARNRDGSKKHNLKKVTAAEDIALHTLAFLNVEQKRTEYADPNVTSIFSFSLSDNDVEPIEAITGRNTRTTKSKVVRWAIENAPWEKFTFEKEEDAEEMGIHSFSLYLSDMDEIEKVAEEHEANRSYALRWALKNAPWKEFPIIGSQLADDEGEEKQMITVELNQQELEHLEAIKEDYFEKGGRITISQLVRHALLNYDFSQLDPAP